MDGLLRLVSGLHRQSFTGLIRGSSGNLEVIGILINFCSKPQSFVLFKLILVLHYPEAEKVLMMVSGIVNHHDYLMTARQTMDSRTCPPLCVDLKEGCGPFLPKGLCPKTLQGAGVRGCGMR